MELITDSAQPRMRISHTCDYRFCTVANPHSTHRRVLILHSCECVFHTSTTTDSARVRLPALRSFLRAALNGGLAAGKVAGSVSDELFYLVGGLVGGFVFPDADWGPAGCSEAGVGVGVSSSVAGDLGFPVLGVAAGLGAVFGAAVPEAAVYEDRYPQAGEHHVSLAAHLGQRPSVHEEAQATPVQRRADEPLRSRIAGSLLRHALRCRSRQRLRLHVSGSTSRPVAGSTEPGRAFVTERPDRLWGR